LKNSALNIFLEKIVIGIGWHFAVGREVAGFGAHNKPVARAAADFELGQRRANAAFAALKTVINRGIQYVDAAFGGSDDGGGISRIGALVGLTEVCADANRRQDKTLDVAKMAVSGAAAK
jgi:hypothetical protein